MESIVSGHHHRKYAVKEIQLILTNPCLAQWNDMQEITSGRYCDRCSKDVYDLTEKSDLELLAFFKNKQRNVCGRLLASQLNRPLVSPAKKPSWNWLLPMALVGAAISPSQAQNLKPVIQNAKDSARPSLLKNTETKLSPPVQILSGMVIDSAKGKPVASIKIRQSGFQNVLAVTDSAGKFELNLINLDTSVPFNFEFYGETVANLILTDKIIVKIATPRTIMLGAVVAGKQVNMPLYIVYSGKKKCELDQSSFGTLVPDWIESIEVLKGAKTTAAYGKKAANGVILIGIKKDFANRFNFSKKNK